ncbi:MAG: TolC family protein [Rhodoblastus sp.]
MSCILSFEARIFRRAIFLPPALLIAGVLAGCASFSPDGGMSPVAARAGVETKAGVAKIANDGEDAAAQSRAKKLLKGALTADRAVQIAFLRNKGLQVAYNDLGISEAQYVADSLPPNPVLTITRLRGSMALDIERRLIADILALATLPARQEVAAARWRVAQQAAIADTLKLSVETRRQYWRAVAARAQVKYLAQARATAETTAELTRKLAETGALSKLDQGREFAFYAELSAQLARARTQETVEKERLTRLMGLWGADTNFHLPLALPRLPGKVAASRDIEAKAIAERVDIAMARADLDRTAKSLGLTQATRFVDAFAVAAVNNASWSSKVEADGAVTRERSRMRGFEAELEVPIFDFGQSRTREAEEVYMRAVNTLVQKAVDARSQVREAYAAYKGALGVSRLYTSRILPLRSAIQKESLLRYNGMLSDLFELIQDARARILSNVAAIDAQRDFLVAETNLHAAMMGAGVADTETSPAATSVAAAQ